jgi:hypothetical protein
MFLEQNWISPLQGRQRHRIHRTIPGDVRKKEVAAEV